MVGKPEGKRSLAQHKRRWEDNTKFVLQELRWRDMEWLDLALDRDRWRAVVHAVINLHVPHRQRGKYS